MMAFAIPFPDIGPEIFSVEIGGVSFALRWYAMAYIVGIVVGWRLATAALRRPALWAGKPAMTPAELEEFLTWLVLGIILGGRLGFVLFYQPAYYLAHPLEIPMIWQGGMAFHGGLLGVAVAALWFCRRHGLPLAGVADVLALGTPPGIMLGRIANFINGELWGRPTDAPWGVVFPGAELCEGVAGLCARHPSQLYEATLEGLVLGGLLIWLAFGRGWLKRPGQIVGMFLAGYGAARFTVEFFRLADPQFIAPGNPFGHVVRAGDWGLTMGQLLTLPMVALGLLILLAARSGRWTD